MSPISCHKSLSSRGDSSSSAVVVNSSSSKDSKKSLTRGSNNNDDPGYDYLDHRQRSSYFDSDSYSDTGERSSEDDDEDRSSSTRAHPEINEVNVVFVRYPDECLPKCCTAKCTFWDAFDQTLVGRIWAKWRMVNFIIVEHPYFETFIIIMILASSGALVRKLFV